MLLGDLPATFLVEVIIRIVVLFVVLIVAMRVMGRRVAADLTRNELLAVVSLAAACGPSVQDPQRGLLPMVVVAALVVLFHKVITRGSRRSEKVERAFEGAMTTLIVDGRMDLRAAKKMGISRDLLLAQARVHGQPHLGKIERLYLEPDGEFTCFLAQEARSGLSSIPPWDEDFRREQAVAAEQVCANCGARGGVHRDRCRYCGARNWTPAVT